ncbi:flagellar protein FlaG [Chengkuizengella axinellae]|uniref:Flagellar protein FlaG n=1 Tax=Chengkuizengella axinellae TaxID=3064388 RepID=A0ABT9J2R2_9BACL|nr:flagellar protein FlaG [Chengkuizengella sp. 2205SS18-9]MDP5275888.1 flagellar protein FlaG [Chengkuizengella sp. 2205SS18-9]
MSMNISFDANSSQVTPLAKIEQRAVQSQTNVSPSLETDRLVQTVQELKRKEDKGELFSPSEKQLVKMVEQANNALALSSTSFEYIMHEKMNEMMVKVINKETGELIREVPPEKMLDLVARSLEMAGIIIDERR